MTTYCLDLDALWNRLGGPTQVAYLLGKMGLPVSPNTPRKWAERGSCDGLYLANLLAHEALAGDPIDLTPFIVPVGPGFRRPRSGHAGRAASARSKPARGAGY